MDTRRSARGGACTASSIIDASRDCRRAPKSTLHCTGSLAVDEPQYFGRLITHERFAATRFHIKTHEWLGIRATQVEAPFCELHRQTVREINRQRLALIVLLGFQQYGFRIT